MAYKPLCMCETCVDTRMWLIRNFNDIGIQPYVMPEDRYLMGFAPPRYAAPAIPHRVTWVDNLGVPFIVVWERNLPMVGYGDYI